jgi:hypothetical protein
MEDWSFFPFLFLIPIVAIVGGFTVAITSIVMRSRVRELQIRERIAMIERGLVPPPEKDPQGFDRAMRHYEHVGGDWPLGRTPGRYRSVGITLMGVGFGLMIMLAFAGGAVNEGVGVGGFLVVVGLAFFVNSFFSRDERPMAPPSDSSSGPPAVT